MAITATDVKKLRDLTGAGMMDAKKALTEAEGDFEKAAELLRITGAAKAAKRADRDASNGIVAAAGSSLIQLGAETDFVAKNADFVALAQRIVEAVDAAGAESVASAHAVAMADGTTVAEAVAGLSAVIGEKLELVNVRTYPPTWSPTSDGSPRRPHAKRASPRARSRRSSRAGWRASSRTSACSSSPRSPTTRRPSGPS